MKLIVRACLVLLLMLAPAIGQGQEIASLISYQGFLTDARGKPLEGVVPLTFRLYDAVAAGKELWMEEQKVSVKKGYYQVLLGAGTPLTLAFDQQYFLGVAVAAEGEMTPRLPLSRVPYAFYSQTARTVAAAGVDAAAIQADAVDGSKVADLSLTGADIADGSLAGGKLADDTVTGAKVQNGSLYGADLAVPVVMSGAVAGAVLDARNTQTLATAAGIYVEGYGAGIHARSTTGAAGYFEGDVQVTGDVNGQGALNIVTPAGITLQSNGNQVTISANGSTVTIDPAGKVTIQGSNVDIAATDTLNLSANTVNISSAINTSISSGMNTDISGMNVEMTGGALTTIKGGLIKLN